MELNVGDSFECPEGHNARIVWLSEDKKVVAVRCSHEHLSKVLKVVKHPESTPSYRNQSREERKIFLKNLVFVIKV
ncbi:MAG: hypothetical protein QG670_107 [Thermoproteota archaeon]|nr:hypothetical protein [Thermoproteota archaeon]